MIIQRKTIQTLDPIFEELTNSISKKGYAINIEARFFSFSLSETQSFSINDLRALFFDRECSNATSSEEGESNTIISGKLYIEPFSGAVADINESLSYASAAEDKGSEHLGFSRTITLSPEKAAKRLQTFWKLIGTYICLPPTTTYSFAADNDTLFSLGYGDLWQFFYVFLNTNDNHGIAIVSYGYDITA